jgi:hypothetical protein
LESHISPECGSSRPNACWNSRHEREIGLSGLAGDQRRFRQEQVLSSWAVRGLAGVGASFRRPPAGCVRDAIVVSVETSGMYVDMPRTRRCQTSRACMRHTARCDSCAARVRDVPGRRDALRLAGSTNKRAEHSSEKASRRDSTPRGRRVARRSRRRRSGRRSRLPCRTP